MNNPEALGSLVPIQAGQVGAVMPFGTIIGQILYWNGVAWVLLAPGADGQQLTTHGAGFAPTWEPGGLLDTAVLGWGNNSVSATTTTRYLCPWFSDVTAETAPTQLRVPRAGTARNLRVRHNVPAGNGNDIVYTLRVNSVATALAVTLASDAADGSDLVDSVAIAAGDLLDIEVTKAVNVGTSPSNIVATLEFA